MSKLLVETKGSDPFLFFILGLYLFSILRYCSPFTGYNDKMTSQNPRGYDMLNKEMICSLLRTNKEEMSRRYGVTKIGLCGSYSRDEQRENSDIDIVVELESSNTFRSFFGLKFYLEQMFDKHIDLGIEHAIKPAVRDNMLKSILYV